MTDKRAYTSNTYSWRMQTVRLRCFLFLLLLIANNISAQEDLGYDEILIDIEVPRLGRTELISVIREETLYLPVSDLFDFLKLRNITDPDLESVSGFFIDPESTFLISRAENNITYLGKITPLEQGDLIRTETNLYLKSTYFGKVFGLECVFNFRSLSVKVNSQLELPMIKEMRLKEMRNNLTRLKGELKADTTIGRSYPGFQAGVADWSAIASQELDGRSEARLNLSLGAMLAGGEATASLNYNTMTPFTEKQQYYQWRYVNNDFNPVRQVALGKITTNAISSIYNPVVGVKLTNTPTTYRRSFGTYTLADRTEPGWIVELYVNNVLVDYVEADASGFFKFEIPLVYGNSVIQLKFFGPWGEERTREQNINIPYNFLPVNTLEYTVSAGIVEDTLSSIFSRASINYGLTRTLTLGTGIEYLSSVKSGPAMPYLNASLSLFNNLLLSAEYTHGVRAKGILSYSLPGNLRLDLNYTLYDKDQQAINYNYREERKAIISAPLKIGSFSTYQRVSMYQIILPSSSYTTGEWLFSGSLYGMSTNITSYAIFIGNNDPNFYSNMSLAKRFPAGLVIMPQIQYGYTHKKLMSAKLTLQKTMFRHGFLDLSLEQNLLSDIRMAQLGFRYDFSFAQAGSSVQQSDKKTSFVQYARGSFIYDKRSGYLGPDNRPNVGKGGITVIPYLDLNSNKTRDPGEPMAFGLNLRVNGGRVQKNERDSTIRILGLEPYTQCFIDLDPNSFSDISWRLPVKTLSVTIDPNILKTVEIPVAVVGEASGTVTLERDGDVLGLERMIINFYNEKKSTIAKTLTEADGYFSYFGLVPGSYYVAVDTVQLRRLRMLSEPDSLHFNIASGAEGDFVDGLDFRVRMKPRTQKPEDEAVSAPEIKVTRKDTTYMIVHEVIQEVLTSATDSYAIQLGAFTRKANADAFRKKLETILGKKVEIFVENGMYKVRILGFDSREEVDEFIPVLKRNGINELWVITLKGMQKHYVITTRQDTITEVIETVTEITGPRLRDDLYIQVGAFRDSARAEAFSRKVTASIDRTVVIVPEDGYYKVRVTGFFSPEERNSLVPFLNLMGITDIWIKPVKEPLLAPMAEPEKQPDIEIIKPDEKEIEQDSVVPLPETEPGIKVAEEPKVSMQVGVFRKRSEALRAQRRITRILGLPTGVVQEFDYYKVIISGFYTREETYKYYPELTGLGYPNIYIIIKE